MSKSSALAPLAAIAKLPEITVQQLREELQRAQHVLCNLVSAGTRACDRLIRVAEGIYGTIHERLTALEIEGLELPSWDAHATHGPAKSLILTLDALFRVHPQVLPLFLPVTNVAIKEKGGSTMASSPRSGSSGLAGLTASDEIWEP